MLKEFREFRSNDDKCVVRLLNRCARVEISINGERFAVNVDDRAHKQEVMGGYFEVYPGTASQVCAVYWQGATLRPRRDDCHNGEESMHCFTEVTDEAIEEASDVPAATVAEDPAS